MSSFPTFCYFMPLALVIVGILFALYVAVRTIVQDTTHPSPPDDDNIFLVDEHGDWDVW